MNLIRNAVEAVVDATTDAATDTATATVTTPTFDRRSGLIGMAVAAGVALVGWGGYKLTRAAIDYFSDDEPQLPPKATPAE